MESPLSSRRITRSQALSMAAENNNSNSNTMPMSSRGENLNSRQKTNGGKNQEREKSLALIDITNGSPIVGLAMGSLKTPSSKRRMMIQSTQSKQATTPGSGESLLRGQVKTLLQKVEEEGVISKISFEHNPSIHKRFLNSPITVLAPTPANTPQVFDFSTNNNAFESFAVSPVAENFSFSQMLNEIIGEANQQEEKDDMDEKNVITRSLFMDFSDSSDCKGSDTSLWSVQVNASTSEEYKDEEDDEEEYKDEEDDEEEYEDEVVDELCEGMSKISVKNGAAKFTGKHIRFVYNSDGELEELESSSLSSKTESRIL